MSINHFDCIVIGAGPGGYVAAIRSAQRGLKTAIIEKDSLGGVCLNWGCIPTKALLRSAHVLELCKSAFEFGINVTSAQPDFTAIIQRSRDVVNKMSRGIQFLLKKNDVISFQGHASFISKEQIKITAPDNTESIISADNIIIATGARPRSIPSMTIDGKFIITSKEALSLKECPKKMLIVGAGAIGIEFAYFFNSLGTDVTVVEIMDHILPIEDREISITLAKSLSKKGLHIKTKTLVKQITIDSSNSIRAVLENKNGEQENWTGDICLVAIGVQGNIENLALDTIGVQTEKSFIKVDGNYRTNIPNIYAIGDIIGPPLLAHVASNEGIVAIEHIVGNKPNPIDYKNIPGCTYCMPQVASIGLTEDAARAKYKNISIGKFSFIASGKAVANGETEGFVKVIIDTQLNEILGIHIIHAEAAELIGEAAIIRSHEATTTSVCNTIHAHPTLSEAIMEAVSAAIGQAVHT